MANIKQQKKRIITNEKRRQANASFKSKMRTAIKKVKVAVADGNLELATTNLNVAYSLIDKAVKDNIVKKNWAANHKSQLGSMVSELPKKSA